MRSIPTLDSHIHRENLILTLSHFGKQKEQGTLLLEAALKMPMGHRTTRPRPIMLNAKTSGSEEVVSSLSLEGYQPHNIHIVNNSLTFKRHFMSKLGQLVQSNLHFKEIPTTL